MRPAILMAIIVKQQLSAQVRGVLNIWTIYDHPKDHDGYIVRCFEMDKPTDIVLTGDLKTLRSALETCGLVPMMRNPTDDPVIVETWL